MDTYKPSEHDKWMLKLKWQLRRESRFAEEIINGEHQCPEGAMGTPSISTTQDTGAPGDADSFQLARLSRSQYPLMSDTDSKGSSDSSEEEEGLGTEQQAPGLQELTSAELAEAMEIHLEMLAKIAYDEGMGEAQRRATRPAPSATAASGWLKIHAIKK